MRALRTRTSLGAVLLLLAACGAGKKAPVAGSPLGLGGTSWQLVGFVGGDDTVLTPDDRAKYTIAFGANGRLNARIDCNRGHGTWQSPGPGELRLGLLALTRAACPPGSLHDQIVKDWEFVRSYVLKDGHLFLSLMADGGIYQFEPIAEVEGRTTGSPVASTGPIIYVCTEPGGGTDTLTATFYQTQPATVLVKRGRHIRPAFGVPAASGAKYEGEAVTFWDARGEASVTWSGAQLACKPRGAR